MKWNLIWLGIVFAFPWSSASAATKIALLSAQPFVIAVARFFIAGVLLLIFAHGIKGYRVPRKKEWKHIMIYGLLNVSIYLGFYIFAMQKISAGLGTLAVAMNPIFISVMAAFIFKGPVGIKNLVSLALCFMGVFIAAYPLLETSHAELDGILIMLASMLAYSAGAIYYSKTNWNELDIVTVNGWQTLLGGLFLVPVLLLTFKNSRNHFDVNFWSGTLWLAIPVSIGAVQCWMMLLKDNAARASYWLFLCPVFGFLIAAVLLHEPLSIYTAAGVGLVLIGLYSRNVSKKSH